ncbi:unnamed protein product [Leptidea sinapis]|uniref:Uncharacterized protein n=1 Tax=Leptidea sinapis TaxID=189913 RepID=A0A5E4Q8A5_9NEOP|nr:unnamed protein product [Leptidea sinapis]
MEGSGHWAAPQLGLGDRTTDAETLEAIPKLQNKKCISISAGTSNGFAVTDSGEVYAWGMGSEGQLGTGGSSDANEPTIVQPVLPDNTVPVAVAAGAQHTVLLVDKSVQKEATPQPEPEPVEDVVDPEPVEEKPRSKRAKEQDQHISSTSSQSDAQAAQAEKINGDEKKDTAMEVDDAVTDKIQNDEDQQTDKQSVEENSEQEESKPESMDTSSQDTVESQPEEKEKEREKETPAIEPAETEKMDEVNGTEKA